MNKLVEQLKLLIPRFKQSRDHKIEMQVESLQTALDGYLGADCPLCGYAIISEIAHPFIDNSFDIDEIVKWNL